VTEHAISFIYRRRKAVKRYRNLFLTMALLAIIPTAFLSYLGLSSTEILLTFTIPLAILLFLIYRELTRVEKETSKLRAKSQKLEEENTKLKEKVERLRNALFQLEHLQKSHSLLREFLEELSKMTVPAEILPRTYEYLKKHVEGIRGLSVYLKNKSGTESTLIFKKGDTSPPKLRLEADGIDGRFVAHIGFDPSKMPSNLIDDITKVIHAALKEWEEMMGSFTDPLTGVYTRKFLDMLKPYLEDPSSEYCLMMIDLDNFKHINDTKGHKQGDTVLKETAQRIANSLRGDDILIRYGGDEFLVVLKNADLKTGIRVGERIRTAVRSGPITASIGVAYKKKGVATTLERALKLADALMYRAKKEGDNVVGGAIT
jgi:diguanylate cyclase (GGDEF)-like protein